MLILKMNDNRHKLVLIAMFTSEHLTLNISLTKNPKPNKEKENKMGGYEGVSSMNHLKFMEFNDCTNFSYLGCCVGLMLPICAISCHLQPFHIHTLSGANEGLQVFVLFNPCVGIMWDVPNAPQINAQDLQKPIQN